MKVYCRLRKGKKEVDRVTAFTSKQAEPGMVVVSSRAIKKKVVKHFESDRDLNDGCGILKSCVFYNFDRVFRAKSEDEDFYGEVVKKSLYDLFSGKNAAILDLRAKFPKFKGYLSRTMGKIMSDVTMIRNIPGNNPLIPKFRIYAVLKEGFYDMLKKNRIVRKFSNLTETHITNSKSFDLFKTSISKNYALLDKDFTNCIVFELTIPRRMK